MTEYRITAKERVPDSRGEDRTELFSFRVTDGDRVTAYSAHATGSLEACGSLADVDWPEALSMVAIGQIERMLLADALDFSPTLHRWQVDDEETILSVVRASKRCDMRRPAKTRGLLCTATATGNPEPTTLPLCETCDVPDARVVCSGLVHPVTVHSPGGVILATFPDNAPADTVSVSSRRSIASAFCEVHLEPQKWDECHPWGRDCWYRIVDTREDTPPADSGAPRRIVDEVAYLRLVYADHFGVRASEFWPASEPSAYAVLLDPCASRKHFERHVVVLDDVLGAMKPHSELAEDRRKNGSRVNGVTAMGRVLDDRVDGADHSYVDPLQALKTIRNSFSHESGPGLLAALRSLGVEPYPPHDWQMAWWQIAASVAQALAAIRSALQTTTVDDQAESETS